MLNIAIFCHDHKGSGANLSLLDWLKNVNKNKINIIVVLPRYNKEFYEKLKDIGIKDIIIGNYFVTVRNLYKLSLKEYVKKFLKNLLRIIINPIAFIILKRKLKKRKVELIHSNSFAVTFGIKLAINMKIPHIWHIREFMEEDHKIAHYESDKKISKYCKYSEAICISDVIKNKYNKKIGEKNIHVIYDKVEYDDTYVKNRKFCEDNICNILIAGTLSINKGQLEAIKAVEELKNKEHKNIILYICGKGDNEENLKKYVKEHNLNDVVKFEGQVEKLTDFRKKIDIALVCSKSEALGRVTVEGMYYENLVIGANVGCTPYIIDDKNTGILYESGNYKDLAYKIEEAIKAKQNNNEILKKAKEESIERFYHTDYCKKIINIYDNILKNKSII